MAVDMFLKLDEVKGEANDDKHKGEIDVLAWSWGISQSGSFHVGAGGGAGKASFQDISVTKWVDKASSSLMRMCATGEHIPKGQLTVRKAGKQALEYIIMKLEKIMVTSVSTGGSGGEDRLTENVTLNFAKIDYVYKPQKPDGSADGEMPFKADIAANKFS
jgi:type VI secretion system secreted protein Hcp